MKTKSSAGIFLTPQEDHVKGINPFSSFSSYGDYTFPIGFEVIKRDMHFCDVKTKKEKRQSSITKNQHFRALTQQAVTNQVKFEYVLADNWFGAVKRHDKLTPWRHELLTPTSGRRHQQLTPSHSKI